MGKFGITKDTKSKNLVPIEAPYQNDKGKWVFPIAKLVSVESTIFTKKDSEEVDVLDFRFRQPNGKEYLHREFIPDENRDSYQKAADGLNSRLKHIYEAFAEFPEKGIGTKAKNWKEFFDIVADSFQDVKENNPVYLKLVYYNGRLGFPLSPNFIDSYIEGKPTSLLTVNLQYDKVTQETSNSSVSDLPNADNFDFDESEFEDGAF